MPRFSEEAQADIYDDLSPETGFGDKIRAAWTGLQRVEVYRWEKNPKTKSYEEALLGTVFALGDEEDDNALPEPGSDPIDDVNVFIRWCVSLGIQEAEEQERRVGCRCRIYCAPTVDNEKLKHTYGKFEAAPPDEEEEEEEEDEDDPRHPTRRYPLRGDPRDPRGDPRDPRFGGGRLGMGMYEHQQRAIQDRERLAAEREDRAVENERQARGDAMEYLRDRTTKIEEREDGLIRAYQDVISGQATQIKELTNTQNSMVDATIGGRRAELEARRESNAALTNGIQMQFEVMRQRTEMVQAGADSRVADAEKGSKHRLWEALLVPVVSSLPTLVTSFASMYQATKTGQPVPVPAPTPPQQAPPPQQHRPPPQQHRPPAAARPAYQPPAQGPATGPSAAPHTAHAAPAQGNGEAAPGNPIATGQTFAGCFITCNEVYASLTPEQKKQLEEKYESSVHSALMGWLRATSDEACVAAMALFQHIGKEEAYKILDEVMDKAQEEKMLKVINQIQASQPNAPTTGSVIDAEASPAPG